MLEGLIAPKNTLWSSSSLCSISLLVCVCVCVCAVEKDVQEGFWEEDRERRITRCQNIQKIIKHTPSNTACIKKRSDSENFKRWKDSVPFNLKNHFFKENILESIISPPPYIVYFQWLLYTILAYINNQVLYYRASPGLQNHNFFVAN